MKTMLSVLACAGMVAGVAAMGLMTPRAGASVQQAGGGGAEDAPQAFKRVVDSVTPALVTVKFVMKIEAGGQAAEMFGRMAEEGVETEVTGVMIEPSGLVLVSNTQLGGYFGMMASRYGGGVTANPTDIKILQGEDTEGLTAKMLARDKDLDLAWIKIDDAKAAGKTFPYVDFAQSASPALGERLLTVERKGKFFDHAIAIGEGRVAGTAKKPRPLIIPGGGMGFGDIGMPVFDWSGRVVGVSILQMPNREDMEGGDASDMMSGGGMAVMVLPAGEVSKATARGKELAAKNGDAATGEPAKTDAPKDGAPASDK